MTGNYFIVIPIWMFWLIIVLGILSLIVRYRYQKVMRELNAAREKRVAAMYDLMGQQSQLIEQQNNCIEKFINILIKTTNTEATELDLKVPNNTTKH